MCKIHGLLPQFDCSGRWSLLNVFDYFFLHQIALEVILSSVRKPFTSWRRWPSISYWGYDPFNQFCDQPVLISIWYQMNHVGQVCFQKVNWAIPLNRFLRIVLQILSPFGTVGIRSGLYSSSLLPLSSLPQTWYLSDVKNTKLRLKPSLFEAQNTIDPAVEKYKFSAILIWAVCSYSLYSGWNE